MGDGDEVRSIFHIRTVIVTFVIIGGIDVDDLVASLDTEPRSAAFDPGEFHYDRPMT